ncbi:hypothetical protein K8R78_05815 [bacterium]|nr:hypothetical protein [bacterium]
MLQRFQIITVVLLLLGGVALAQDVPEDGAVPETPAEETSTVEPGLAYGENLIDAGRYDEAVSFFSRELSSAAGLSADFIRLRLAVAKHLAGLHKQAYEELKIVVNNHTADPGTVRAAVFRAISEMIINERALRRYEPPKMPTPDPESDEPLRHPRDNFHFTKLSEVPDLRRTTRSGDSSSLDVEELPEDDFDSLTPEELLLLTPTEREEYEAALKAWTEEQEKLARRAERANERRSFAEFDLYYATYYLALLRELDPTAAEELKQRVIDEVINVELEVVAWFLNYSMPLADFDQAVTDAVGSAPYWGKRLLTRECARMIGERFNLYLFSRFCGRGIGYHDVIRYCNGRVRLSTASLVTVKQYDEGGIGNPGYRAYAAMNGSMVLTLGEVMRYLGHHPDSWRIPYLRDFGAPEEGEGGFLAGESEFTVGYEKLEGEGETSPEE